jgi:hypothetical protein
MCGWPKVANNLWFTEVVLVVYGGEGGSSQKVFGWQARKKNRERNLWERESGGGEQIGYEGQCTHHLTYVVLAPVDSEYIGTSQVLVQALTGPAASPYLVKSTL